MSQNISLVVLVVSVCVQLLLAVPALPVRDPTSVPDGELMGMVRVTGRSGRGTGMVIGSKTVLTAAHIVCTEDWVGGNDCDSRALVEFQDDPHTPELDQPKLSGTVTVHPHYNPSWMDAEIEHDLAIITLDDMSPAYATPLIVSADYLAVGSTVMLVGQGRIGSDCSDGNGAFVNFQLTTVRDYGDPYDRQMQYDDVGCPGDSGGAVLDAAGSRLHGVHSYDSLWGADKAITTAFEFDWIESHACLSHRLNQCSDIVWRRVDGTVAIWHDGSRARPTTHGGPDQYWQIQGVGDFDGNGKSDILWRHVDGTVTIWLTDSPTGTVELGAPTPYSYWQIQGVGDFDGNGKSDILWRFVDGTVVIWHDGSPDRTAKPGATDNYAQIQDVGKFE
jgi:Trypsin/FG-GAP-like repeat